jgi:hypothetical protein
MQCLRWWMNWDAAGSTGSRTEALDLPPHLCELTLVQQRFPAGRHSARRSWYGLILGMRMRRKQPHALDHRPLLVIVEPILTRLEAGNDRMPRCRGMFGCMMARRTVAASDVPALRAPAEMKPPTFRRRQAFHTPIAARLRSGVDSALIFFHFDLSSLLT